MNLKIIEKMLDLNLSIVFVVNYKSMELFLHQKFRYDKI